MQHRAEVGQAGIEFVGGFDHVPCRAEVAPAERIHGVALLSADFHQMRSTILRLAPTTSAMAQRALRRWSLGASSSHSARFWPAAVAS